MRKNRVLTPARFLFLALFILIQTMPGAAAEQYNWNTGTLAASHEFPEDALGGDLFTITGSAWSITNAVDFVTFQDLEVVGDCTVVSDTVQPSESETFATFVAVLEQGTGTCSWHRNATAVALSQLGGLEEVLGQITISGAAAPFQVVENGQDAGTGFWGFYFPVILWGIVLAWFLWHQRLLGAVVATLAFTALFLPEFPFDPVFTFLAIPLALWLEMWVAWKNKEVNEQ